MRGFQGLVNGDVLAGRYRVVGTLGIGGMSRVLLAEDLKLAGKRWAVKELGATLPTQSEASLANEADLRRMMQTEADTLCKLSHPSLPDIVDVVKPSENGFLYLVMELIEGETVQRRFERQRYRMEAEAVLEISLQLCGLLDYLHSIRPEPVIHRDLKPSNLMIEAGGRIRLIDFGTARTYKPEHVGDTVNLGTIGFAAPEQFDGRQSDPRTDLYGLGALMYYLLSGGDHYAAWPERDAVGQSSARSRLPADLEPIVLKLLKSSPAERYGNAREAGAALQSRLMVRRASALARISDSAAESGNSAPAPGIMPMVIVVGGMYSGAGATFVALSLAQALNERGIPHVMLEPPLPEPELAALLFGDKRAPKGYRYYNEAYGTGGPASFREHGPAWTRGHTLWLPSGGPEAAGHRARAAWEDESAWRMLFQVIERPIWIADIGANWEHASVRALLSCATDVIYVADPSVHKLHSPAYLRRWRALQDLTAKPSRRRHGFVNKNLIGAGRSAWLQLLPEQPSCILPVVEYSLLAEASWQGRLSTESPVVWKRIAPALQIWLNDSLRLEGNHWANQTVSSGRKPWFASREQERRRL